MQKIEFRRVVITGGDGQLLEFKCSAKNIQVYILNAGFTIKEETVA